jgi:hypothetical protein
MRNTSRRTDTLRGRKKAVAYAGAAAALLGAGTAGAAAFSSTAHAPTAVVKHTSSARRPVTADKAAQKAVTEALATAGHAVKQAAAQAAPAGKTAVAQVAPVRKAASAKKAQVAPAKKVASAKAAAPVSTATVRGSAKPAAPKAESWSQVEQAVAKQTSSTEPKAADQLQPVGTSGAQAWMPLSSAQLANATTIVRQALDKGMGLRSAVIAVATAMQESQLQNINYGDRDSLGLFQQRPSCGWGPAAQITDPAYAADAFLNALHQHQASNPGWVHQPLWANAQSVQNSGFPFAYAKWETQAVHMVKQIATQVK